MEVVLAKPAQDLHQPLQLDVGLYRVPGCLLDMIPPVSSRGAWGKINTQRLIQTAEELVSGSPGASSLHLLSSPEILPTLSLRIAHETGFSPEYTHTQKNPKPKPTNQTKTTKQPTSEAISLFV